MLIYKKDLDRLHLRDNWFNIRMKCVQRNIFTPPTNQIRDWCLNLSLDWTSTFEIFKMPKRNSNKMWMNEKNENMERILKSTSQTSHQKSVEPILNTHKLYIYRDETSSDHKWLTDWFRCIVYTFYDRASD